MEKKKDQLWDRKTLLKFRLNASVFVCFMLQTFALIKTEAFSQNVGKASSLKVGVRKLSFPWCKLIITIPAVLCSSGHPVWNLRTKTPNNEQTTVPWHQDNAYLDPSALHTLQPTAWVPLIDATVENGCMQASWGERMYGVRVWGKIWLYCQYSCDWHQFEPLKSISLLPNQPLIGLFTSLRCIVKRDVL